MTRSPSGALWIGLYVHIILLPLAVGSIWLGGEGTGPRLMPVGTACGYAALTILILELALISKIRPVSSVFGQDALLRFHRRMGILASVLIAAHGVAMMSGGYPIEWLNPFDSQVPWAMRTGVWSAAAVVVLIAVSLGRRALGISYDWWQLTHGGLADAAIVLGFAHIVLFGGAASVTPLRVLLWCLAALAASLRVWFKFIRPLRVWSRPWVVEENRVEHGNTHTLVLRPVGHDGFLFEPGQFAWLSTARTPFHPDRHPISMSSAARDMRGQSVAFTIKNLGDWSGDIVPSLKPGRTVWVDGPHGVFTADRHQGPGYVLIGGGSGIAPLLSICETFAERRDGRPVVLFFASHDFESLTFRERLGELAKEMNLTVVYVLENPPSQWAGERGLVSAEILRTHLPPQFHRYQYFVCGPEPMMDSMEETLTGLGVPPSHIHTERFVLV